MVNTRLMVSGFQTDPFQFSQRPQSATKRNWSAYRSANMSAMASSLNSGAPSFAGFGFGVRALRSGDGKGVIVLLSSNGVASELEACRCGRRG